MMLAETLPDPNHFASIGWVCVAAVAIIIGLRQGMKFVHELKDKPAPGDVRFEAIGKFATKEELFALSANNDNVHKDIFHRLGGSERGLNQRLDEKFKAAHDERRADIGTLHKEINSVGLKVAGLEKETELQNQSMARMDLKLDRLIERT